MANQSYPEKVLDDGWKLREEYGEMLKRRAANRRMVRDMALAGDLPQADVDELYPPKAHGEAAEEAAAAA